MTEFDAATTTTRVDERVVLLGEDGEPIGTAAKSDVHTESTPLHLAFSCHLRNAAGEVLITRRALTKRTWPGVWTNSFCGHPQPGEDMTDAIRRRAEYELGITVGDITLAVPDFRYRAVDASGLVENEICPVFTATLDGDPAPRADEVGQWVWADPMDLVRAVRATPWAFSPWLALQIERLDVAE